MWAPDVAQSRHGVTDRHQVPEGTFAGFDANTAWLWKPVRPVEVHIVPRYRSILHVFRNRGLNEGPLGNTRSQSQL